MTELFLRVVNMSITASVLVLPVLVLQLLLKKAPKWVNVLLWGLVAIRLVCPFAIESPFSLMPKTDWIEQSASEGDAYIDSLSEGVSAFDPSFLGEDIAVTYYPNEPQLAVHRGVGIPFLLSCIWVVGMAAMLSYLVFSYLRIYRQLRSAKQFRDNIYNDAHVASPFVFGVIKPRICIPESMDAVSMSYVIAHEQAHIRRHDHWWKPFGFLLLTIHWFNPVMWLAYVRLCRDIEMACDECVVRDMGESERADYSEALLECSVKRSRVSACPVAFGEVGVKQRIRSVLNYKKPAFRIIVLAMLVCAAVAVCFLTDPIDRPAVSIDDHDWYFERAYSKKQEKNITIEAYQPGLQPKTENAEPVNAILIPEDEPMWYQFVTGDRDTDRIGLHFIPERVDSRASRYTVELYRDTGERYTEVTSTAVIEPMKSGDGYILTIYKNSVGAEEEIVFTTKKQSGAVNGKKKLTLEEVLTLSEKSMAITWEDLAEYSYNDVGSGLFVCSYEIDETFYLQLTGGSMHGTPMSICLYAKNGESEEYVNIRRTYADEHIVEEFIAKHKDPQSLLFGTPVEWFYETAWEIAQQTAQEHGLALDKNIREIIYSDDGEYVGVEFYEPDRIRHSRIAFFRDENGNYTTEPPEP